MNCVFCRIIQGEVGDVVAESKRHVVVVDINPLAKGHLLVIPKHHANEMHELPDEYLRETLVLIKRIKSRLGSIGKYNILQNNGNHQEVPHVHFHFIPFDGESNEGLKILWKSVSMPEGELAVLSSSYKSLLKDIAIDLHGDL